MKQSRLPPPPSPLESPAKYTTPPLCSNSPLVRSSSCAASSSWMLDARSPVAQLVNFAVESGSFEATPRVTYLTRSGLKHFLAHGIRDVNRVTLLQV